MTISSQGAQSLVQPRVLPYLRRCRADSRALRLVPRTQGQPVGGCGAPAGRECGAACASTQRTGSPVRTCDTVMADLQHYHRPAGHSHGDQAGADSAGLLRLRDGAGGCLRDSHRPDSSYSLITRAAPIVTPAGSCCWPLWMAIPQRWAACIWERRHCLHPGDGHGQKPTAAGDCSAASSRHAKPTRSRLVSISSPRRWNATSTSERNTLRAGFQVAYTKLFYGNHVFEG